MRKIETTDSRLAVIQKFEDTMEYLKSQSSATVTEMERILQSDESSGIYLHPGQLRHLFL